MFCCPLCGSPLSREAGVYRCPSGHSYDIAREGYVHLLPANRKHSAVPGDDKGMAGARRDFLSRGYYEPLLQALQTRICQTDPSPAPVLVDAGCGEGYYTAGIYQALRDCGRHPRMAGVDLSKFSLRIAARREKAVEFAVASSHHLPLADGCGDILLNCFSPLFIEEFFRVLRPGGWFFYVVPGKNHLWELKEVLYDHPYPNEERPIPYPGFSYVDIGEVDTLLHLEGQAAIHDLFQMTPYYWKTPRSGAQRLETLDHLTVQASFRIHIFQKDM